MTSHLTLLDWKSSGFRTLEEELQISAYFGCTHVWEAERQAWMPWREQIDQAGIVHVWEEGCKVETRLMRAELETAYAKFEECLDVFNWMVDKGKVRIPENESYRVNGRYFPSVTYIIQHVIAKPNLMNWSYEMGVSAGVWAGMVGSPPPDEGVDFGKALDAKARLDAKTLKRTDEEAQAWVRLVEWLHEEGKSATARRDGRASEGSSLHNNILFFLQGRSLLMTDLSPYLRESLTHFMGWAQRVKLSPVYLEQKLMHEERGYAGTADFIGDVELDRPPVAPRATQEAIRKVTQATEQEATGGDMSPVSQEDQEGYYHRGGNFVSIKKLLKPGESVKVKLLDIARNTKTNYPIKDQTYCYRITLQDDAGKTMLMDLNGADAISQMMRALYPKGVGTALSPCWATLTRRSERTSKQSELVVVRDKGLDE